MAASDLINNSFNLSEFRAKLGDGARSNQFYVRISGPGFNLSGGGIDLGAVGALSNLENSPFLVTAASLPGQSIGVAPVFYRGREVKLAGDRSFQPWATTILNDADMMMRTTLEGWMNSIENMTRKDGLDQLRKYSGTLQVTQLNKNGDALKTYILDDAWPAEISEIPLSFDSNDQISAFTCTWVYSHFRSVATTKKSLVSQAISGGLRGILG